MLGTTVTRESMTRNLWTMIMNDHDLILSTAIHWVSNGGDLDGFIYSIEKLKKEIAELSPNE